MIRSLPWHLRDINISSHLRSLGVIFYSALSFAKHIYCVIKSCNFCIRNIGRIRQFLSKKACEMLVVALVTSRLDYCNSLLNGLSQTHMLRLQRVQNTAARLICRIKKFDHFLTSLQSLHCFPLCLGRVSNFYALYFELCVALAPFIFKSGSVLTAPHAHCVLKAKTFFMFQRSESKNLLYVPPLLHFEICLNMLKQYNQ